MKLGGGGTSVTDDCRNEKAAQNGTFVLITHNQSRRLDVEVSPDARRAGQEYGRHVGAGGGDTHFKGSQYRDRFTGGSPCSRAGAEKIPLNTRRSLKRSRFRRFRPSD